MIAAQLMVDVEESRQRADTGAAAANEEANLRRNSMGSLDLYWKMA